MLNLEPGQVAGPSDRLQDRDITGGEHQRERLSATHGPPPTEDQVVRLVQDLRKTSGLEVSDRIRLHVEGLEDIAEHFPFIAREVLATEIVPGVGTGQGTELDLDDLAAARPVRVWLQRADRAA